jgi:ABC-2 type transport system ATP-binding protein
VSLVSQSNGLHATLQVSGNIDNLIKALSNFPVHDLDIERPSLEEIFLTYYEAASEEAD